MYDESLDKKTEKSLVPLDHDPRIITVIKNIDALRRSQYVDNGVSYPIIQGEYNQAHWDETLRKYKDMLVTPELLDAIHNGRVPFIANVFAGNLEFSQLTGEIESIVFDVELVNALDAIQMSNRGIHYGIFEQMAYADNLQMSPHNPPPIYNPRFSPSVLESNLEYYVIAKLGKNALEEGLEIPQLLQILQLTKDDLERLRQLRQLAMRSAVMHVTNLVSLSF